MMTQRRSLEQKRAKFAYDCVQKVIECKCKWKDKDGKEHDTYQCADKKSPHKNCGKYKAYVKKIPMLIKTNGLAATFAFVKAKSDHQDCNSKGYAYHLIYQQTENWLRESDTTKAIFKGKPEGLIQVLISQESPEYRQLSTEVMALFVWLKRAAEGLIEGEDEGG